MTHKEVAELLKALAANYGKKLDAKTAGNMIDAWMLSLGELEAPEVYKAARLHMNTSKFFPNPADILDKLAKARIVYGMDDIQRKALPVPPEQKARDDYYLGELCKFVGLGCEPDDDADLILKNFLPYEK